MIYKSLYNLTIFIIYKFNSIFALLRKNRTRPPLPNSNAGQGEGLALTIGYKGNVKVARSLTRDKMSFKGVCMNNWKGREK